MKRGSMQCKIPEEIRERLSEDIFMSKCCLQTEDDVCTGGIQWHHNLIYAGKRVNEWWAILPVCVGHHILESAYKNKLNRIMVSRASDEELLPYCKVVDYVKLKHAQNKN